jgi:hypothetical protein
VVPYAELESFFTTLVATAQQRGITCAITSGMACVHFGVAATTKDCDVLCVPEKSDEFRALIAETKLRGLLPNYRGNISPPLDARWMRGGWTSHFTWKTRPENTCLDVFGIALRGSSPWDQEVQGFYASRHTVAEMKRTNREKDWPFITALGVKLLKANDVRGCLHLYETNTLLRAVRTERIPGWMIAARPALKLALDADARLEGALHAETVFWHKLDERRIGIYERALRPYVSAVRKAIQRREIPLAESHAIRIDCAHRFLEPSPIRAHGLEQLVQDARAATATLVHPSLMDLLPNGLAHFIGVE